MKATRPHARIRKGEIQVKADYDFRHACKSIGHATWRSPYWVYIATPQTALRVRDRVLTQSELGYTCDDDFAAMVAEAVGACDMPRLDPVPGEIMPSFAHQREAFWAINRNDAFALFDDMGTGKSKPVVDAVCHSMARRTLILCPKPVCHVWVSEFAKHAHDNWHGEVIHYHKGTVKQRAEQMIKDMERCERRGIAFVAVINYESIIRAPMGPTKNRKRQVSKLGTLAGTMWDFMVCDESHRIKSYKGVISRTVSLIAKRARKRVALTGTPLPHSPLDAWAQYRFLDPSILPRTFTEFRGRYAVMGGFGGLQVLRHVRQDELRDKMYSIARRVRKRDVLDLPPVTHETYRVELTGAERKAHAEMERDLVTYLDSGVEVTAANTLVKLLRMQQSTSGFIGVGDNGETERVGTSKRDVLSELVSDIDTTEPVVVFCRFKHDLDAVKHVAESLDRPYLEISGRRNDVGAKLDPLVEIDGDVMGAPIVGAQIQSGGVGVDMTASAYCVFYSTGFNMGDFDQATARLDRNGQTRPVTMVHLIAECPKSIDVKIKSAFDLRRDIVEYVVESYQK